jgi:hypothetical protein
MDTNIVSRAYFAAQKKKKKNVLVQQDSTII